jgi:hypothetical protein
MRLFVHRTRTPSTLRPSLAPGRLNVRNGPFLEIIPPRTHAPPPNHPVAVRPLRTESPFVFQLVLSADARGK